MFNTELIITWAPNNTGQPDDANPAYNPVHDITAAKLQEMKDANLFKTIIVSGSVSTLLFANVAAATEYQTFLTEILNDFNQVVPEFSIVNI